MFLEENLYSVAIRSLHFHYTTVLFSACANYNIDKLKISQSICLDWFDCSIRWFVSLLCIARESVADTYIKAESHLSNVNMRMEFWTIRKIFVKISLRRIFRYAFSFDKRSKGQENVSNSGDRWTRETGCIWRSCFHREELCNFVSRRWRLVTNRILSVDLCSFVPIVHRIRYFSRLFSSRYLAELSK